jgi:ATP-dependent DNA helicase RecQ
MTGSDWSLAQQSFSNWPTPSAHENQETAGRLADALAQLETGQSGPLDVATLTRQVLLEHAARTGQPTSLQVPHNPALPGDEHWRAVGCSRIAAGGNSRVFASPWHPSASNDTNPGAAAFDMDTVHQGCALGRVAPVPPDPFWTHTLGYEAYRAIGQRQAARTVATAPPGSLTIVSLPTGSGKTAIIQAAAKLHESDGAVCIVVVPTVVLALDMERRIREFYTHDRQPQRRYAYVGGMNDWDKQQLRNDVAAGTQPFLFTSPEALVSGLSGAIVAASKAGRLGHLVIDEAHLIEQWGAEFRPEFQTLGALREALLSVAPINKALRTVAMSATLNRQHIDSLVQLFPSTADPAIVWASELRREPSFYVNQHDSETDRVDAVLTSILRLPKPAVLYVSTREDAKAWTQRLRQFGLRRLTTVTGESNDHTRRDAVEGWRGSTTDGQAERTRYDVVVATSAFGLGVDMPNVRTVHHACIPETIDRYYQEVGRGGRDRRPCLAVMNAGPNDPALARSLNDTTVITAARAWDRWQRMQDSGELRDDGLLSVDLDARPVDMQEGYQRSRQWNVRTLNLMQSAKLIRLRTPTPPDRAPAETPEEWQRRLDLYFDVATAQTLVDRIDGSINDRSRWDARIESVRQATLTYQRRSLTRMMEVLNGQACVGQVLASHYRADWQGGLLTTSPLCRGCSVCREASANTFEDARDPAPAVHPWPATDPAGLLGARGASWVSIWWSGSEHRRDLVPELLERLARRGLSLITDVGLDAGEARRLQRRVRNLPIILDYDNDLVRSFGGPLVALARNNAVHLDVDLQQRLLGTHPTILIHPAPLRHPERSDLTVKEFHNFSISVQAALSLL